MRNQTHTRQAQPANMPRNPPHLQDAILALRRKYAPRLKKPYAYKLATRRQTR